MPPPPFLTHPTHDQEQEPNIPSPIQTTTNIYHQPIDDPFVKNLLSHIPPYVLQHAPLVHLHSQEPFWPACHETHLRHSTLLGSKSGQDKLSSPHSPSLNNTNTTSHQAFQILSHPDFNHEKCYMTARIDVRRAPQSHAWLVSEGELD